MLILPFVFALASTSSAQDWPKSFNECWEKALASGNQNSINRCAGGEATKLEAQLDAKLKQLLELATSRDWEKEADRREAVDNIKANHAAWVKYRDTYLEALYPGENKQQLYGTSYISRIGVARIRLTLREIQAKDDLIAEYSPR